jgi:hypothetical protein
MPPPFASALGPNVSRSCAEGDSKLSQADRSAAGAGPNPAKEKACISLERLGGFELFQWLAPIRMVSCSLFPFGPTEAGASIAPIAATIARPLAFPKQMLPRPHE